LNKGSFKFTKYCIYFNINFIFKKNREIRAQETKSEINKKILSYSNFTSTILIYYYNTNSEENKEKNNFI